ncbi:MAG: phage tail tube protein [Candidatus Euphemobacter frigidus]|nr:phage tail tube protein [Candidatus Euphemobacter frigidus]
MGNSFTGREILVGLKKAGTWRTAVECGAKNGLLILSETFKQTLEHLDDDSAALAFIQRTDQGKIGASGGMEMYMRYEGLDLLLALIMGTAGTPSQQAETAAYANSYVMSTDPTGLFATLAMLKKSDKVFEYPSVKFNQFSLTGEMNAPLKLSVEGIANLLELASATNTAATMANITYPDKGNRIIFNKDAYFRINDEDDDALDSADNIYPAGFSMSFNRPVDADLLAGHGDVDEPIGSGFPELELTLNFPRYNDANDAFFTDWEAFTRKKMEIYFKGGVIEGAYYYEFKLSFPNLKAIDPDAAISGPGAIPVSLSFKVLGNDTAPTGMTGITAPFQVDAQNTLPTDPLA